MNRLLIVIILIFGVCFWGVAQKHIVVDPGHNYDDIASEYKSETEVLTNWAVAKKFEDFVNLNSAIDWFVHKTRINNNSGTENRVSISQRADYANDYEADYPGEVYFLSIHCNAADGAPAASGTETFFCDESFKDVDKLTAYGNAIHNNTVLHGNWSSRRMVECGDYDGTGDCTGVDGNEHLCVLHNLIMPNLLSEIAFVTNANDEAKLLDDNWRDRIAWGYIQGFLEAFSDLEVVSYSISTLPNFTTNNLCKISVMVENKTPETYNGDLRAMLKFFPSSVTEEPIEVYSQLGSNEMVFLPPGEQTTIEFSSQLPTTMEIGVALCIESRKNGSSEWKKASTPSHKKIIKIPLNGARVNGVVYDNAYNPLPGVQMWSYKKPGLKSAANVSSDWWFTNDFNPTTGMTDNDGNYDFLVPRDWCDAIVSVKNYTDYDEQLISTKEDSYLIHNYTSTPTVLGVGSGASNCVWSAIDGTDPEAPIPDYGYLQAFDDISINGQTDLAFICKEDNLVINALPRPLLYSKINYYSCNGTQAALPIYFQLNGALVPYEVRKEDCNMFGKRCKDVFYNKYFLSVQQCDHNRQKIGDEYMGWFFINKEDNNYVDIKVTEIPVVENLASLGATLQDGSFYKFKLAIDAGGEWKEYNIFFYTLPSNKDDLTFSGTIIEGEYYAGKNAIFNKAIINAGVKIIASNEISIKNSDITGDFEAYINPSITDNYCSSAPVIKSTENPIIKNVSTNNVLDKKSQKMPYTVETIGTSHCACEAVLKSNLIERGLNVFPNPAHEIVEISTPYKTEFSINIIDIHGKTVKKLTGASNYIVMDVSGISPGIYFVCIVSNERIFKKKLLIE